MCTPQSPALQFYSQYSEASLRACLVEMHAILDDSVTAQLQAVRKKYTNKFGGIAASVPLPPLTW